MLKTVLGAAATLALLASGDGVAVPADESSGPLLKGKAAFGGWQYDKPGVRRLLTRKDLPPIGKSTPNFSEVVPVPAGAEPRVPAGFSIDPVASGLANPRVIRTPPNGDLFVADSGSNTVRVLRVPAGNAKPGKAELFASGLYQPFGIAFYPLGPNPEWIYIANSDSVVRYPYKTGDLTATGQPEKIVERIAWVHHWTRDIVFSPDGKRLLLSVGSGSNVAPDMFPEPLIKGGLQPGSRPTR
jgi:glucose/arabinose dehydrogenase